METTDETDVWQDRLIHYVSSNGVVYLVMADDSVGRRMPFAFLAEVERRVSLLVYFLPSFLFFLLQASLNGDNMAGWC